MKPRLLLINPPIYDFSAYDFWLKPIGLLRVAGYLRRQAEFQLFDFTDRFDRRMPAGNYRSDSWGRGEFYSETAEKPPLFADLPRQYRRFGIPRREFQKFLDHQKPFECALIQTSMTYWYLGVREVIEDLRRRSPNTKIVLGGVYTTLCPAHARRLGANLVASGLDLDPLWRYLRLPPEESRLPLWDLYPQPKVGVIKLTDGCPFRCSYCSVPQVYPKFHGRSLDRALAELELFSGLGIDQVAFYDDALLFRSDEILRPFLREVLRRNFTLNFHTPNAINARFVDRPLAELLIRAGFKNIFLGFESSAYAWQKKTGGKIYADEFARAVDTLLAAGADSRCLHAYLIAGHPAGDEQDVELSMNFAHHLGIKVILSEFSPIPGTPDGEACRRWIDIDEPLNHNKTAFVMRRLGGEEINRLKNVAGELNRALVRPALGRAMGTSHGFLAPRASSC